MAPDWHVVTTSFVVAMAVSLALCAAVAAFALVTGRGGTVLADKSYDFSKSWASNVTLATAAGTLLANKDVLTDAVGGSKAGQVLAATRVATLSGAALVAVAPLLVGAFRRSSGIPWYAVDAAAALTLTGAGGAFLSLVRLAMRVELGGLETSLVPLLGVLLLGLLAAYAVNSLRLLLPEHEGATERLDASSRGVAAIL